MIKRNHQIMDNTNPPMDNFYEHMKIPVPGLGSIYLSSEPKGLHVNLQTTQTVVQALHKQILRACY